MVTLLAGHLSTELSVAFEDGGFLPVWLATLLLAKDTPTDYSRKKEQANGRSKNTNSAYRRDLLVAQRALGHRDISTTEIYTHLVDGRLEEALECL